MHRTSYQCDSGRFGRWVKIRENYKEKHQSVAFVISHLAVRVSHHVSRGSVWGPAPGSVARLPRPVARTVKPSKINAFLTCWLPGTEKPMVFHRFFAENTMKPMVVQRFLDENTIKTNVFNVFGRKHNKNHLLFNVLVWTLTKTNGFLKNP